MVQTNNMRVLSDQELVAQLHTKTSDPNLDHHIDTMSYLYIALVTAAAIGTYQNVVFNVLKTIFYKDFRDQRKNIRKVAYQITNMTVNLCLGTYGFYHFYTNLPDIDSVPITERISGFPEYAIFGALQVGYNVWALPIGAFFMNEPISMLAHHVAVLCVGGISCFGRNGFRYHAPFFFGVIEISSVPLAIVNFCKNNRELVDQRYPNLYLQIRIVFSVIFFIVRVIMWTPLMRDVLRSAFLLGWTCHTHLCGLGLGCFWLSATFLSCLQYYWALLILKGYVTIFQNMVQVRGKKSKES